MPAHQCATSHLPKSVSAASAHDHDWEMVLHKSRPRRLAWPCIFANRTVPVQGPDLIGCIQEQPDAIADEINNRPRNVLGVRSPLAVVREQLLNNPKNVTFIY